jgi:hypothetical protein
MDRGAWSVEAWERGSVGAWELGAWSVGAWSVGAWSVGAWERGSVGAWERGSGEAGSVERGSGEWSVERGAWRAWSVERGAWSVERGAWSVERGAWSVERGAWSVERGAWSVERGAWSVERGAWERGRGAGARSGEKLFWAFEGAAEGEDHFALLLEFRKQWSDLGFLKIAFSDKHDEHVGNFVDRTAGEFEKVGEIVIGVAAGAFGNIVCDAQGCRAQLLGKSVVFSFIHRLGQIKQRHTRGGRAFEFAAEGFEGGMCWRRGL